MEEKILEVLPTCTRCNFGLKLELDLLYRRSYVLDVETKSSAVKLVSSIKAIRKAGHRIFSKSEATTALAKI